MTLSLDDYCRLQDRLYEAALGEVPFADALNTVVRAFDGAGGVVFELNRRTGEIFNWVGPGLEAGEREYAERLNAINPRMRFSLRHAPGVVAYDGRFIDDRTMDRHEFYATIERLSEMRYFLGTRLHDEGDVSVFHSIEFLRRHGHPGRAKIEAFQRVMMRVGDAWRLAKRRAAPGVGRSPWTPDHLPWAIMALAADGRVVESNARAEELTGAGDVLRVEAGRLVAVSRKSDAAMQRLLAAAAADAFDAMLVETSGPVPLILQAVPVPAGTRADPSQPAVVVYVWDMLHAGRTRSAAVQRLFGLSDAEARIVELLSGGTSLNDVAERLEISRNTARNHLQSVFAKTGTRRQGELLAQVLGVVGG